MPLEPSFAFINDLNPSNPAAADQVSQGDDHLRGIKNALKANIAGNADDVSLIATTGPTTLATFNRLTGGVVPASFLVRNSVNTAQRQVAAANTVGGSALSVANPNGAVQLAQTTAAGVIEHIVLSALRNSDVTLLRASAPRFSIGENWSSVMSNANTGPRLRFTNEDLSVTYGDMRVGVTSFDIGAAQIGRPLSLRAGNFAERVVITEADSTFYRDLGARWLASSAQGATLRSAETSTQILLTDETGATIRATLIGGVAGLTLRATASGLTFQTATGRTVFLATHSGDTDISAGVNLVRFRARSVAAQNAGAAVADAGGTLRAAGYNVMIQTTGAGDVSYGDAQSGTRQNRTAANNITLDQGTLGTTFVITALAEQQILEGIGVTITWYQGTSTATGPRTLAAGGVMTVNYASPTTVHVWGSGLT